MKRKSRKMLFRWAIVMTVLVSLFAAGPVWAQTSGATQGDVAMNLANLLGLSLPMGATPADAISALAARGIAPAGGWNANAPAGSSFIGSLYLSVQAALTAGRINAGALGSASAIVAAAGTQANIPRVTVVNAIADAGGNRDDANQGASYGGSYGNAAGPGPYGPAYGAGGGGGGGANPSPSR